jgi:hypothetical protein
MPGLRAWSSGLQVSAQLSAVGVFEPGVKASWGVHFSECLLRRGSNASINAGIASSFQEQVSVHSLHVICLHGKRITPTQDCLSCVRCR